MMDHAPESAHFRRLEDHVFLAERGGPPPLNVGLILGEDAAVLIDPGPAGGDHTALLAAVRELSSAELIVVNTHGHPDHVGANDFLRRQGVHRILAHADAGVETATDLVAAEPVTLPLGGGVEVVLEHLGRGHTQGDLVVGVRAEGSTGVVFCGDLVREGDDPEFHDSYPKEWVRALGRLWSMAGSYSRFVPGHGHEVDADFIASMRRRMQQGYNVSSQAIRESVNDATKAIPIVPYGPGESRELITRLRGR
ncbi:MBL fold metallo-hydrolase [Nesterenkonia sp. AN1]|uniref:MBL fold metallo-hydrolase n=1 Tax=Nesterenkonia sp. AN1 TaxID=652017 RepID=UPI001378EDCF|nr:MBL fold metallo-hydrolase [Nesterenkonia sp. AN1]